MPTVRVSVNPSGASAIAYETVIDAKGRLPLLAPMSEIAVKMSRMPTA